MSEIKGGYLFLLTALGILLGTKASTKLLKSNTSLELIPLLAFCIALSFLMLHQFSTAVPTAFFFLIFIGFFGGFLEVLLFSYLQVKTPQDHRGKILGLANCLSFLGVLCAALFLYFTAQICHYKADQSFFLIGLFNLIIASFYLYILFDEIALTNLKTTPNKE